MELNDIENYMANVFGEENFIRKLQNDPILHTMYNQCKKVIIENVFLRNNCNEFLKKENTELRAQIRYLLAEKGEK